jgi:hypothetical protein
MWLCLTDLTRLAVVNFMEKEAKQPVSCPIAGCGNANLRLLSWQTSPVKLTNFAAGVQIFLISNDQITRLSKIFTKFCVDSRTAVCKGFGCVSCVVISGVYESATYKFWHFSHGFMMYFPFFS